VISWHGPFWQIVVVPEIVAVGSGATVMVTEPAWFWEQLVAVFVTLKREYVVLPLRAGVVKLAVPAPFRTIDWAPPGVAI
jgi:hypothetical protein